MIRLVLFPHSSIPSFSSVPRQHFDLPLSLLPTTVVHSTTNTMKSVAVVVLLASSAFALNFNPPVAPAAGLHDVGTSPVRARLHIAQSKMRRQAGGRNFKRCKPHSGSSSAAPASTPAPSATKPPKSTAAPATTSTSYSGGGGSSGGSSGVINVKTSGCGDIGATSKSGFSTCSNFPAHFVVKPRPPRLPVPTALKPGSTVESAAAGGTRL